MQIYGKKYFLGRVGLAAVPRAAAGKKSAWAEVRLCVEFFFYVYGYHARLGELASAR